jgi:hypothetical protein
MNKLQYVLLTVLFIVLSISLTSNYFLYQQAMTSTNNAGMIMPIDFKEVR